MLDDIPALESSLAHKSSLLAKVRRQQVAKNLPDYIFSGLASLGCSDAEISTLTRCPKEDLRDKAQVISEGKARLKHALRKAQIKAALRGNSTMLVWLGKAILGQSDQPSAAPQHTNIVVTADLLSSLQRSYQATLSDIRRTKAITPDNQTIPDNQGSYPDNQRDSLPHNQLAPLIAYERGTVSVEQSDALSEPSIPELPLTSQHTGNESLNPDSLPITSHNTDSVQSHKSLIANEPCVVSEAPPPHTAPPTRTPTPTPKRVKSLGLEKVSKKGKVTKWAQYSVVGMAGRWSANLKRIKGASQTSDPAVTRGGSREGDSTLKSE